MTAAGRHRIIDLWGDTMDNMELILQELQRIHTRLDKVDGRLDKVESQKEEIIHEVKVLLDTEVTTRFNLLAEEISIIREKLTALDNVEQMQDDIFALQAVVKAHTREINKLKKAQ